MKRAVDRAVRSIEEAQELQAEADTRFLRSAIQQYYAVEGRFPASLENLPEVRQRGMDPSRWVYDPTTGKVDLRAGNR